jgi:hypothetical protein
VLAAAGLRLRFNGALTFGTAIGDESQAFPMHGCETRICSHPCAAADQNGKSSEKDVSKSRTWRRRVFQNAVGGGGVRRQLAKKGNAPEREGGFPRATFRIVEKVNVPK